MEQRVRILLVEDDPDYAMLMNAYVNQACGPSLNYVLQNAERLEDGLALLAREEFDIVLLDLLLPDSEGLQTLTRMREGAPGVPVVVLTNVDQDDVGLEAIARGAQDFLSKSKIDARRLSLAVGFALQRDRLFRQIEGVVDASPDGTLIVDRTKTVRYANPAALALLGGRKRQDLVGRVFAYELAPERRVELKLAPEPGREISAEMRVAEIDWRGAPAWLATIRDVTELRKLEAIRAEVRERARGDQLKDQLLSTVAHELRSPLSVVKAVVGTLRDRLAGPLNEEQAELIVSADRNINRLTRLLNNFLDLSRLESRRARVSRAPLDPLELVREIVAGVKMANRGRRLTFALDLPSGSPEVRVDADMIAQVLSNLLENAVRYARARVTVRAAVGAEAVEVSVVDDGPGIPSEKLGSLFDKFVQLDRPRGGAGYKGTGLGLAISREIMGLNGGRIWAENAVGRGACFRFTMPLVGAPDAPQEEPRAGLETR
ncbi:MAG: response regulator [Elusimicrobia bacterium]|nr:response regulator [Elusimicrobiota bacterium]